MHWDSPSPLQLLQWSMLVYRPCICRAPTKTPFNQQSYHGRDELFPSDHYDDISMQSVEGPCRVLTRGEYTVRRGAWDLRKTRFCMFHTHSPQIGACSGLMYHLQLSHQEATEQVANGLKEDDGIPCFYTCVEYKVKRGERRLQSSPCCGDQLARGEAPPQQRHPCPLIHTHGPYDWSRLPRGHSIQIASMCIAAVTCR